MMGSMAESTIGWRAPQVTPALSAALRDLREERRQLQKALAKLDAQRADELVRALVVGSAGTACDPPLDLGQSIDQLCESCLEARGPLSRGLARRMLL